MLAYVDSSCLLAIALAEPGAAKVRARLGEFELLLATPLVEAEVCSACRRESAAPPTSDFSAIHWAAIDRRLSLEIQRVLEAGYLRGADCWHLAASLYLSPDPRQLTFLTLDARQRGVAKKLGFRV